MIVNIHRFLSFGFALSLVFAMAGTPRVGARAAADDQPNCTRLAERAEYFDATAKAVTNQAKKDLLLFELQKVREAQKKAKCPGFGDAATSGSEQKAACAALEEKADKFEAAIKHATDKEKKEKLIVELNKIQQEQKTAKCPPDSDSLKTGSGPKLTCAELAERAAKFTAAAAQATDKEKKEKLLAEVSEIREEQKRANCPKTP